MNHTPPEPFEAIAEDWNESSHTYQALKALLEPGSVEFCEFGDAGNAHPDDAFLITEQGSSIKYHDGYYYWESSRGSGHGLLTIDMVRNLIETEGVRFPETERRAAA